MLLSITAPLAASHPPGGIARVLMSAALFLAALAVLAGALLLHAPVRQSQVSLEAFLSHCVKEPDRAYSPAPIPLTHLENICRWALPLCMSLAVVLLGLSVALS